MNFVLERTADPESEPVTLAEMRRHLKEFDSITARDDDITALIVGAREWVEDYTGRALMDQTWRLTLSNVTALPSAQADCPPHQGGYYCGNITWSRISDIMLRKSPVLAITSFVSVDADGDETTIDAATYELREADSKWPRLAPLSTATWSSGTFRVTFRAGFADTTGSPQQTAAEVPERFKQAMKLWVQANYDIDPVMTPLLLKTAEALIKSERSELGMA